MLWRTGTKTTILRPISEVLCDQEMSNVMKIDFLISGKTKIRSCLKHSIPHPSNPFLMSRHTEWNHFREIWHIESGAHSTKSGQSRPPGPLRPLRQSVVKNIQVQFGGIGTPGGIPDPERRHFKKKLCVFEPLLFGRIRFPGASRT